MTSTPIKDKYPLVEAILELHWDSSSENAMGLFGLMIGIFFVKIKGRFPEIEKLSGSEIPSSLVTGHPHYRFRAGKDKWPLIQLGPGILTVNEADSYDWSLGFSKDCLYAVRCFFESIKEGPSEEVKLSFKTLRLRYINGFDFDYSKNNIITFLKEKLKVNLELPEELFKEGLVHSRPKQANISLAYDAINPSGVLAISLLRGLRGEKGEEMLYWELVFSSSGEHVPDLPNGFEDWLESAHQIIDHGFFSLYN